MLIFLQLWRRLRKICCAGLIGIWPAAMLCIGSGRILLSDDAFDLTGDGLEYRLPYLQVVFAMVQTFRTGV